MRAVLLIAGSLWTAADGELTADSRLCYPENVDASCEAVIDLCPAEDTTRVPRCCSCFCPIESGLTADGTGCLDLPPPEEESPEYAPAIPTGPDPSPPVQQGPMTPVPASPLSPPPVKLPPVGPAPAPRAPIAPGPLTPEQQSLLPVFQPPPTEPEAPAVPAAPPRSPDYAGPSGPPAKAPVYVRAPSVPLAVPVLSPVQFPPIAPAGPATPLGPGPVTPEQMGSNPVFPQAAPPVPAVAPVKPPLEPGQPPQSSAPITIPPLQPVLPPANAAPTLPGPYAVPAAPPRSPDYTGPSEPPVSKGPPPFAPPPLGPAPPPFAPGPLAPSQQPVVPPPAPPAAYPPFYVPAAPTPRPTGVCVNDDSSMDLWGMTCTEWYQLPCRLNVSQTLCGWVLSSWLCNAPPGYAMPDACPVPPAAGIHRFDWNANPCESMCDMGTHDDDDFTASVQCCRCKEGCFFTD
eukprot:gene1236-2702_t